MSVQSIYLELDGGDLLINLEEIASIRKVYIDEPGDRTEIRLRHGGKLYVPDSLDFVKEEFARAIDMARQ